MSELLSPHGGVGSLSINGLEQYRNPNNDTIRQLLFEGMLSDAGLVADALTSRGIQPDVVLERPSEQGLLKRLVTAAQFSSYWVVREKSYDLELAPVPMGNPFRNHSGPYKKLLSLAIRGDGALVFLEDISREQVLRAETLIPNVPQNTYGEGGFIYCLDMSASQQDVLETATRHLNSWRADLVRLGQRLDLGR